MIPVTPRSRLYRFEALVTFLALTCIAISVLLAAHILGWPR